MSPADITEATIRMAFSVSSTMPTPTPTHETHVYHRGGIRGKVESLIYGVSDKLLPKHYKPFYRGTEAERRARLGSIVELQEMGSIHPAA